MPPGPIDLVQVNLHHPDGNHIHVDFTAPGSAYLYYYLTLSDDAGNCNGSSQHSRTKNAPSADVGDFGNVGGRNIPIPAKDILSLPTLTVTKLIDRDDNGSYESTASAGEYRFTLSGPGAFGPKLTDANGVAVFDNVAPDGSYTITEEQITGAIPYELDSVSGDCTLVRGPDGTATIALAANTTQQNATCTFNNGVAFTPAPALSLSKSALPVTFDTVGETISYSYTVTNTPVMSRLLLRSRCRMIRLWMSLVMLCLWVGWFRMLRLVARRRTRSARVTWMRVP